MHYYVSSLHEDDGSWQELQADWRAQCEEAGEQFEDYAPDVTAVLARIAAGEVEQTALSKSAVCGIREGENGRFWAICMVNWARYLPGVPEPTLRVRHLMVSPLLDYGIADIEKYADVLIGAVSAIIHVSGTIFPAPHLRIHLRSPEDVNFFRALGTYLVKSPLFKTVETKGAWLYITKAEDTEGNETNGES